MTQFREDPLLIGQYYHIFSRSIGKFIVFNNTQEFQRFYSLIDLFRYKNFEYKYSEYVELSIAKQMEILRSIKQSPDLLVEIVAYCIMPTHFHLILKQISVDGITNYMGRVLNGYSRYFNVKHHRTGPLWAGRFKNVLIVNDEQMLHLTRYIHLNPTSAGLVENPEDWQFSSYKEYILVENQKQALCKFRGIIDKKPEDYRKFVNDRQSYQRELSVIKYLTIDNYSG